MQRPRMTWLVRLFVMAALGAALALTAQAQTGQAADQNTDPATAAQGQQAGAAAAPEVEAEVAEEPDPNAVAQDGQVPTGTSPGRFIPREQLSQDLGASFPVDI